MKDLATQLSMLFQRRRAKLAIAVEILAGRRQRAPTQPIRTDEARVPTEQRE